MRLLRNLLALIGLLSVLSLGYAAYHLSPHFSRLESLDPKAATTLLDVGRKWLASGDIAQATAWRFAVKPGLSAADVEQTLLSVASEHNFAKVGEKPFSEQIEKLSGKPYRFVKIYEFCSVQTAARMLDHSDAYAAFIPCRIALVEDKTQRLWLYTMNLDLLIHGGTALPPDLKIQAEQVRDTLLDITRRGALGEF